MKFKELVESNNTGLDAIKRAPIVEENTGIKCLRIGDISQNRKYSDWGFCNVEENNYKKFKLQKGDIIIARTGATIGVNMYIDSDLNSVYNNGLIRIKIKKDFNSKYAYYLLQTNKFKQFIDNISHGTSAQPNMQMNDLLSFEIPEHSKEEQDKIAKILNKIDNKIELNNKINDNLHNIAEEIFDKINANADAMKLKDLIFETQTGSRPKGGAQEDGVPSIGAEKIEKFGLYDYSSEKYISDEYYTKLTRGKIESGDVLLYKDGAYTGKVSMALDDFPHKECAINEHVFIVRTKDKKYQSYLYFTLQNVKNKEMIHTLACGKAAQPGLNQNELLSVDIKLAKETDIIQFEDEVKPIMKKIALNALENRKLLFLRDTLLPKLMNGEIDLDKIEI